jgi:membrane protease YdiL (CAAX protease family)
MTDAAGATNRTRRWSLARGASVASGVGLWMVLVGSAALVLVQALLIAGGQVLAGQITSGVLLLIFANGAWIIDQAQGSSQAVQLATALRALALVALIPVVAAGLPLNELSRPVAILLAAGTIGISAIWLARMSGIDLRLLLRRRRMPFQLAVAFTGIPLGLIAYLQGAQSLPTSADRGLLVVVAAAALVPAVEELVFRGVLQQALQAVAGRLGVLVATGLFAGTYLGSGSASLILTVTLAGAIFAASVALTGSLVGAIAGHVALTMGASVVWPAAFGLDPPVDLNSVLWTSAVSGTLGAACAVVLLQWRGRPQAP